MRKGDPGDALKRRQSAAADQANAVFASQLPATTAAQGRTPAPGFTGIVQGSPASRPVSSAPTTGWQLLQSPPSMRSQQQHRAPVQSGTSPSGGTVHHLATGTMRATGLTPFANLQQGILAMSNPQARPQVVPSTTPATVQKHAAVPTQAGLVIPNIGNIVSPTKGTASTGPSPRKKVKLEEKPPATLEIANHRKSVIEYKVKDMLEIKRNYIDHLTEFFFLQNGGNMMDYHAWKRRPTPQLVSFLKSGNLDSDDEEDLTIFTMQEKKINDEVKVLTTSGSNVPLATPVAISTTLPPSVAALSTQQGKTMTTMSRSVTQTTGALTTVISSASTTVTPKLSQSTGTPITSGSSHDILRIKKSPPTSPRSQIRPKDISAFCEGVGGITTQEAIVERAKQEAQVMQRVSELRKSGLWSARRLPKVQELPRNKAHWDYLLEEMQWLAADFVQERKWKKAAARKVAKMVTKHFQDLEQKEIRAEKEEALKLKRIAGSMAKMVREFWSNIERVVQYKQQSRLDEKRKKALDLHLNFIVDQTEKYSSWLTEGLGGSVAGSSKGSVSASPAHSIDSGDMDFKPVESDSDDEETIDKEEQEAGHDDSATKAEIEALQKESEVPIEELLKNLPQEILDKPAPLSSGESEEEGEEAKERGKKEGEEKEGKDKEKDEEFVADCEEEEDLEDTIAEQEKQEKKSDHKRELDELAAEGEMSMEELYKKYAGAYDSDFELPEESSSGSESDDEAEEESYEEEEEVDNEDEEVDVEGDAEIGLEVLMHPEKQEKQEDKEALDDKLGKGPGKELTDIAAEAQSLQPKGYTLQTTEVQTAVPFLLKHKLREYQHVGLDWLATMYEKKLNGILADEMGLGKTIQTIALLAHLACEKGIWGPHLIVVPTSVMLNWEMELKKWAPAFKILTYYGTQKERKLKRQGWTKTNAFHVCITSYKLVIQDHQSFRRKKWKYFILDEAQNIKNFKSQRWQTLLNFQSQRRLLLTGTPLQNSLMELWSLMHFLMPHVFQSHREFKEWFANPLTGMIEGSHEYNESLIRRLHKVLRPFLLRRLKDDVEKQMPKKFEHVVMCHLSKRQRFLYDEFMSQTKTKETLATGHFMSVINILMQLRKVCNHPSLFDPRPIVSPFQMEGIVFWTASLVHRALEYDPFKHVDLRALYPSLSDMEQDLPAFVAHRVRKLQTSRKLIEEIDLEEDPPPRPKPGKLKTITVRGVSPGIQTGRSSPFSQLSQARAGSPIQLIRTATGSRSTTPVQTVDDNAVKPQNSMSTTATVNGPTSVFGSSQPPLQARVLPQTGLVPSVPVSGQQQPPAVSVPTSQPITVQIQHTDQGTRLMIPTGQLSQLPAGFIQIVQTSSGQQLIAASTPSVTATSTTLPHFGSVTAMVNGPPAITTVASSVKTTVTSAVSQVKTSPSIQLPTSGVTLQSGIKPVMRVSPLTEPAKVTSVTSTVSSALVYTAATTSTPATVPLTTTASSMSALHTVHSVKSSISHSTRANARKEEEKLKKKSEFFIEPLYEKRMSRRKDKLDFTATLNKRHCEVKPVYGADLCHCVNIYRDLKKAKCSHCQQWCGPGMVHCNAVSSVKNKHNPDVYWYQTKGLSDIVHSPSQYLSEFSDILDRFVFVTPSVTAPVIKMHASHPPASYIMGERRREWLFHHELSPKASCLHRISTRMTVQFPELRLIQYDCGKLQTLDILLRRLKSGGHRVLLFTQMTKMLDILEAFLNYHGHIYVRLDGTTRVEQRQILMDRFNADKRIFCFILSTRSGGLGVNLTGADTVIFYDSDWNPTMDAQAQDRCHRIGQTRDVHIYRLISERTVEENILKKANQKRMLGDMAIEGGNFTTAFFKEQTIQELFSEPSGLESLVEEKEREEAKKKQAEIKEVPPETDKSEVRAEPGVVAQFEQALAKTEDETDAKAIELVKAEQKAELAEFDENIPWDEQEAEQKKEEESRVEKELALLDKELTPVERYAVNFMEKELKPVTTEELTVAEEDIQTAKKDWELARLQALKEEEERRAELEEDEMLYTYTRDDAYQQVFLSDIDQEQMPIWAPPTPPHDDNDVYIDQTLYFLYEPNIMPETQLPPIHIKKEHKKPKIESITTRKQKQRKEEHARVPRSLFDRSTPALLKLRREAKLQRLKGLMKPVRPSMPQLPSKPIMEQAPDHPEWLIHEDWALLQAVQSLFDVPLNLMIVSPAHTPNWDMVADVVNSCSRVYRSPKQCKNRYENVIIPREEGRILYDMNPRKQKKSKAIYKTKNNRPMKTSQIHSQDSNNGITILYSLRFDSAKGIAQKRPPTMRQTLVNPTLKNPKHASVLQENGITYDQPLNPMQVAEIRAQRIQREKKQNQAAAAAAATTDQQQTTTARPQAATTQAAAVGVAAAPNVATLVAQAITTGVTTPQLATVGSVASSATVLTVTGTPLSQTIRQRAPLAVQEITAVANQPAAQVTTAIQGQTTQVRAQLQTGVTAVTTTLTAAQLAAAQRISASGTTVTPAGATVQQQLVQAAAGKNLTPQQLQMLRTQTIMKQQHVLQQQQQLRMQKLNLTPEQIRQQQQQQQQLRLKTPVIAGQKTVIAQQLVTSMAQAVKPGQMKQVPQLTRPLTQEEIVRIKQQQQLAAQKSQAQAGGTVQAASGSQQLQTTQIIAQAPLQQMGQSLATVTGSQTAGATLVKTVSAPAGSVTIPVSINVSVPQKAGVGAKTLSNFQPQQLKQMQLLQQQRKVQHQLPAKTALGQPGKPAPVLNAVQIIQQGGRSFTVQQLSQLVKQQQQQGGTIQQIIHTSQPTIIAAVSQSQVAQPQMVTKVIGTTTAQTSQIHSLSTVSGIPVSAAAGTVVSVAQVPISALTVGQSGVTASIVKPATVSSVPGESAVTTVQVHPLTTVTHSKPVTVPQNVVVQPVQHTQVQQTHPHPQPQSLTTTQPHPAQAQSQQSPQIHTQHVTLTAATPTIQASHAPPPTAAAHTPTPSTLTVTVTPTQATQSTIAQSVPQVAPVPTSQVTLPPTSISTQPVTVSAQTVQQTVAALVQPTTQAVPQVQQPSVQQQQVSTVPQQAVQVQAVQPGQQPVVTQQQVLQQQATAAQQQSKAAPYAMRTRNQPKPH